MKTRKSLKRQQHLARYETRCQQAQQGSSIDPQQWPIQKVRLAPETAGEIRLRYGKHEGRRLGTLSGEDLLRLADNCSNAKIKSAAQIVLDGRTMRAAMRKNGGIR